MRYDAEAVLEKISAGRSVQFPLEDFDSRVPTSNLYLKLFKDVAVSDIRRIVDFYRNDYKVFAFEIPDIIRSQLDN